ncbi:MAG: RHS repeat-associated core domain-containing protein, partial [Proteobacteria bacterium]|nr:RHS repeat-associated core domain-containing protein [Pseudomonadota bacterium]
ANQNPAGLGTFIYDLRFPGQVYQAETALNQNYFRDFDPLVGRYVESDPLGLRAGINTYAYTHSNPISFIDPSGLEVSWSGSVVSVSATVGIGGQLIRFNLESECKCNVKYRISGFASMLTIGAGVKAAKLGEFLSDAAGSGGSTTLVDRWSDCPDPSAATGFAWSSGVNIVPGVGGSLFPRLDLGRLQSWEYIGGPAYGFDMSIQSSLAFLARSAVTSVQKMSCCSK